VVIAGSKLTGGEELETCGVQEDALRDDPFQEFTTALEEGNRAVSLCNPVIYFTGLRDRDHRRQTPGVMPKAYSGVE